MEHAENDRQLHLDGVGERQLVGGDGPDWVLAKRVDALVLRSAVDVDTFAFREADFTIWWLDFLLEWSGARNFVKLVARSEDVSRDGKPLIVDQSAVSGKESHQEQDVPCLFEPSEVRSLEHVREEDENCAEGQK